jgi:hypothetical protein
MIFFNKSLDLNKIYLYFTKTIKLNAVMSTELVKNVKFPFSIFISSCLYFMPPLYDEFKLKS